MNLKHKNLLSIFTAIAAAGAVSACDQDETPSCTTDDDCAGFVCEIAAGATSGFCSASECVGDLVVNDAGACVAPPCTSDDDCAPYACDTTSGACFAECTTGEECATGDFQCDDTATPGQCIEIADAFLYIAVVSKATGDQALNNPNPGPDLDAISISAGGNEVFASNVEAFAQGPEGDDENTRPLSTHANAVTAKDTVDSTNTCDLDAQPGYVAIGGTDGFIAVSFPREIADGDVIKVYEVDSVYCAEAAVERPDAYEVYILRADANDGFPSSLTAADIKSGWCLVGSSGGNGGEFQHTFDAASCD